MNEAWWVAIIPAIVGFVGVVVGASITTATNYLLVVRKEKAEEAKEELSRENELKTAARMIWSELFMVQTAAIRMVEKEPWLTLTVKFPLVAWNKYKETLARELPVEDWMAVDISATMYAEKFVATVAPFPFGYCADNKFSENISPILEEIKKGVEVIQ